MESFLRGKEVVYTLEYDIPDEVVFERVNKLVGHPYDVSAFAWLALRFLVRKVFHLPFWKIPLWNVSGMYLCTEFVSKTIQKDFPLLTAEQLYRELSTG